MMYASCNYGGCTSAIFLFKEKIRLKIRYSTSRNRLQKRGAEGATLAVLPGTHLHMTELIWVYIARREPELSYLSSTGPNKRR